MLLISAAILMAFLPAIYFYQKNKSAMHRQAENLLMQTVKQELETKSKERKYPMRT